MIPIELNARGLLCPMPVIKVQERVEDLQPGTILRATGTDPGILYDIPAWCRVNGHQVLETLSDEDEYIVVLKVGAENGR